ncbi:MAG: hypothetical protein WEB58_02045 [Planctomycetaceae bacterium]
MYFPSSRKLILTAGLLALGTFAGCSMNRSYLSCPSWFRSGKTSAEYEAEPVPATEYPSAGDSTAPVTPEILLEDVPKAVPQGPSKPMGPQLPEKTISVPVPGAFNGSELRDVEEFDDERSPGDAFQTAPAPGEISPRENNDAPAEAAIPEGLQSSTANPSLLKRFRDGIPRFEVRDVPASAVQAASAERSSASSPRMASTSAMKPTPDPIGSAAPTRQQTLSRTILEYNHNYPYSSVPAAETMTAKRRHSDTQTVSSQDDASPLDEQHASDLEFEFDTPHQTPAEPDPWPFSPASN